MTRRTVRAVLAAADVVLAPAVVWWLVDIGQVLAAAIITALLTGHVVAVLVAWRRECAAAAARYEQAVRSGGAHLLDEQRPESLWTGPERWRAGGAR